jgi:hypothetical protein
MMHTEIAINLLHITAIATFVILALYKIQQIWCLLLGRKAVYFTAWIGTPIHELSHTLVHLLFGHEVIKVVLFKPEPETGVLGYVTYKYDTSSILHNVGCFFAGIAPLVGNLGLAALVWKYSGIGEGAWWYQLLIYYVMICLIMHAAPSNADLHNSIPGIVVIIIAITMSSWFAPDTTYEVTQEIVDYLNTKILSIAS